MSEQNDNPTEISAKTTSFEPTAKVYLLSQIRKLAAAANVAIGKETIAVYAGELSKLSREQLDMAVDRTIREWDQASRMPPIPFITARSGMDAKLAAEQAWELCLKLIRRDWYADGIGWVAGSEKKLSPAMQYAIRQCGGEYRIAYADDESFPFIRRDFLQAHERFELEGGSQIQLTQGEARNLLGQLQAMRTDEMLPEIPEASIGEAAVRSKPKQQTREEYDARMAELQRQARQLKGEA